MLKISRLFFNFSNGGNNGSAVRTNRIYKYVIKIHIKNIVLYTAHISSEKLDIVLCTTKVKPAMIFF